MTTLPLSQRIKSMLNRRVNNRDNDYTRMDEPDVMIRGAEITLVGILLTALVIVIVNAIYTGALTEMIATLLVGIADGKSFGEIYPSFIIANVILVNLMVTVFYITWRTPDVGDVIESIGDHDSTVHEHLLEIEHKLDEIERNV